MRDTMHIGFSSTSFCPDPNDDDDEGFANFRRMSTDKYFLFSFHNLHIT